MSLLDVRMKIIAVKCKYVKSSTLNIVAYRTFATVASGL